MWPLKDRKQIRSGSVAVLIVDMQTEFLKDLARGARQILVSAQVQVIGECAERDIPVIVLEFDKRYHGSTVAPIMNALRRVPRVFRLSKDRNDGFTNKDLQTTLEELGIGKIILMGVNATFCVRETAQSAVRKGYQILTADDLIADGSHISAGKCAPWYEANGTFFPGSLTLAAALD